MLSVHSDLFNGLRAVLFDLDGTLIETHIDFAAMTKAMEEMARSADVPASVIDGKDILGMVDVASEDVTARGGDGAALRRRAFAQLEEMELEGCSHPILLPGTRELLSYLQTEKRRIGIVTRNCRRVATTLVNRYDLPHDVLLSRDDVRLSKPHPEHLWDALAALDADPEQAAMVGDHWMDVQAGKAARCAATLGVLGRNEPSWFAACPPNAFAVDLREALPLFASGGA